MKSVTKKRVADYVEPTLSPASVERMWSGISAGGQAAPAPARGWWLAAACLLLAGGSFFALTSPASPPARVASEPPPAAPVESWLATGAQGQAYPLGNGISVELAPETQVRVDRSSPTELRLRLERGRISCDVPTDQALVVQAGTAHMATRQARFEVELEMRPALGPTLRVGVETGRVTVHSQSNGAADGEQLATLSAGQSWTNAQLASDAPPPPLPASDPVATPKPPALSPPGQIPTASAVAAGAAELLAEAQQQRRAGNARAAADAYDRLRRQHPADARAGLAAFESARIRLDQLNDATGALEAFDAALASGKAGFFAEDAAAGRVRALSALSQPRCVEAQSAFLKTYPKSPHAAAVRRLCQAP